jgi:dipeptidyl aminopeptidase/acylaminoacyl peptidase
MPDVRDVYEMVTQQTPPKPDALERQRKRQMRHTMNRKLGVFGIVAAAIIAFALVAIEGAGQDGGRQPATSGTTGPSVTPPATTEPWVAPPTTTAPWVTPSATSEVDFLVDVNTGEVTQLPKTILRSLEGQGARLGLANGRYAASPDGSTLAFTGLGEKGSPQIFIANIDGTGVRQVTHDPIGATSPAWSPDGTMIAYVGNSRLGNGNLFVLDVAAGESTKISDEAASSPSFMPDGSSLLYTGGTPQFPLELKTVSIAGGESRLLFGADEGITDSGNASMSPDGSLVTFLSSDTPTGEVGHCGPCRLLANADGTNRQVITGWMANPAGTWSPDGSRIVAMEKFGEGEPEVIVVVDVATEEATIVAYGRAAIWLDDRTVLVEV